MPPQVDFYNLPSHSLDDALAFICKLTHKIWQQTLAGYIHCQNESQRQQLNNLLWQFKAESFIPHSLLEDTPTSPIILGSVDMNYQSIKHPIFINLSNKPPAYYQQFERIIEFVIDHPDLKEQARTNYRFYKEALCIIKYHDITTF